MVPSGTIEISPNSKLALFEMEDCTSLIVKPFEIKGGHQLSEITIFMSLANRPPQILQLLTS